MLSQERILSSLIPQRTRGLKRLRCVVKEKKKHQNEFLPHPLLERSSASSPTKILPGLNDQTNLKALSTDWSFSSSNHHSLRLKLYKNNVPMIQKSIKYQVWKQKGVFSLFKDSQIAVKKYIFLTIVMVETRTARKKLSS